MTYSVATLNCALCNLIAHLTFQMRKVLLTKNSNQPPDVLRWGGGGEGPWTAGHKTRISAGFSWIWVLHYFKGNYS